VPEEQFIWLRNAGNIIFEPMSSMTRTLALACAVKGGKEIMIIGHTDCQVGKSTMLKLTDAFRALGVDRAKLPENLTEFFGLFASERQNVMRGAEIVRQSPLHRREGSGAWFVDGYSDRQLEWLVNGYQTLGRGRAVVRRSGQTNGAGSVRQTASEALNLFAAKLPEFNLGEMKFPEFKIGETTIDPNQWLSQVQSITSVKSEPQQTESAQKPAAEPERKFDKERKYRVIGADQKVYGPIDGGKILEWIADGRIDWQRRRRWKAAANGNRFPRGRKGRSRRRFHCRRPSSRRRACRSCAALVQWIPLLALTPALSIEPKGNIERPTSNFEREMSDD